jgi:Protein of Unknown function (DUF2604)
MPNEEVPKHEDEKKHESGSQSEFHHEHHEQEKQPHKEKRHLIILIIIVNGTPANVELPEHDTLMVAAEIALQITHNTGRPITDWEMKKDNKILPLTDRIDHLKLKNEDKLFLSLKAGVGGLW